MKSNSQSTSDYRKFRRKVLLQLLFTAVLAFSLIAVIYIGFWRGNMGDWLVGFFQNVLHMSYDEAFYTYHRVFRYNFELFFLGAALVMFILLLCIFLRRFTRYFDMINSGIDALMTQQEADIRLVPEMQAIEDKLNLVRRDLANRASLAQEAEQRKSELIMYLAHDIRTPLTSVIGYLSLLDEAPDMPTKQRAEYVHITLDKAYRLEQLVNEFFEITRYNSQQIQLEKEKIDIFYMLVQMADEFYPILSAKGNRVTLHADENLTAFGDSAQLARVFNNILKNSAAYCDSNSDIVIRAGEQEGWLIITFQNQGPNIPRDKLAMIFEKFYRLDQARATNTGGAGLGLAIAKEIITLHGGTISAESGGNLTVFRVALPIPDERISIHA